MRGVREVLTLGESGEKKKNHTMKPCLYLRKDLTSIEKIFRPHLPASFPKILVDIHGLREGLTLGESGEKK